MKERPILFSGPMVRAILEGRKTQTRRIIKPQPSMLSDGTPGGDRKPYMAIGGIHQDRWKCPYGQPGDGLWVREVWGKTFEPIGGGDTFATNPGGTIRYKADYAPIGEVLGPVPDKWKSPRFMRKEYSRITLEITGIRVERLQDISAQDAIAEGIGMTMRNDPPAVARYRELWEKINGPDSWDKDPWVWVLEFRRIK